MIVCCTSTKSIGCTFLDWSIHFLSGQKDFFNLSGGLQPLAENPLKEINAHGHPKSVVSGSAHARSAVTTLQARTGLNSFYLVTPFYDQIAKDLGIDINSMTQSQWALLQQNYTEDYNRSLIETSQSNVKIIVVSLDKNLPVYANTIRTLDRMPFENRPAGSNHEIADSIDQVFFKHSIEHWQDLDLNNIWDRRERTALKKNLIEYEPIQVNLAFDHYWIDAQNLWYNGQREVVKILNWLGLPVDSDRFESWKLIYRKWQEIQLDTLQFQYNHQHIVDCIVNNWSYPIDLTFEQEAIVQHSLIYQHNLNLKTWQLEKFPSNTQQLHKLLEPNIHPRS